MSLFGEAVLFFAIYWTLKILVEWLDRGNKPEVVAQ